MGAGKSTMAKQIATDRHAVLLSEDEWLADLFPNKISTLADYVACAQQLKRPIKKLVLRRDCNGAYIDKSWEEYCTTSGIRL